MGVPHRRKAEPIEELTVLRRRVAELEARQAKHVRTEEMLRASEERLRVLLETTDAIPWEASATTWQFTYVGPQAVRLLGYPLEQWYEKDFWVAHIHPEDRDHAVQFCQTASHRYQDYKFKYRMIAADGRVLWIHDIVNVVSVDGEPKTLRGFMVDITAWKQAEEALRESEKRFSIMADKAPVMIWMSGPDKLCTYFNKRWLEFTGRSLEEEMGNGWAEGVHPDDLERCLEIYVKAFDLRRDFEMEYRLRRHDGEYRWVVDTGIPRFTTDGTFAGYIGSCIDISERKRVEEALRTSERRLRQVLDIDPHFIFAKDREGCFTLVNQAVADAYGTTVENLIGKTDADFNPNRDQVEFFRRIDCEVMDTLQEKFIPEEIVTDAQGRMRWLQTVKRPIITEDGIANEVLGSATDITERKRIETALQESEQIYRTLINDVLDTSAVGIFILDSDFRVVWVNQALERFFGLNRSDVVGKDKRQLLHEQISHLVDNPGRFTERVLATYDHNTHVENFECHVLPHGTVEERWLEHWSQPIRTGLYAGGRIEHYSDITERKRLEKAILEAGEREQRRIGRDLHDGLSQHLTGIAFLSQGLVQKLTAKSVPEADEAARITHLVNQGIIQTRDLVRGLYPIHLEATGLVAALQELADHVADIFKISCQFRCDYSIVVHDNTKAIHLYYIVREALNNAIKHGKAQHIVIRLTVVKDQVILIVKDDGIGLPEMVETNKGIGLHTMNHRARMIGASLILQRDRGGGTIMTCSFKTD